VGKNPIEFRQHYDAWIAATKSYADAWLEVIAGDDSERERLPTLLRNCEEAHLVFNEEWKQLFRSSSL